MNKQLTLIETVGTNNNWFACFAANPTRLTPCVLNYRAYTVFL